jgi:hypothetical protein
MGKAHPVETFANNDVVTPLEFNREAQELLAELNGGMDRENMPSVGLAQTKVALAQINDFETLALNTVRDITRTVAESADSWFEIAVGAAGRISIVTPDCVLECGAECTAQFNAGARSPVGFGLFVDGRLVAFSSLFRCEFGSWEVTAVEPVAPGTHIVDMRLMIAGTIATDTTYRITDRTMYVRAMVR